MNSEASAESEHALTPHQLDSVAALLEPRVGRLSGKELGWSLVAGGRSNLTYVIGDGEREWVLRRPPLGNLLPTAHDMVREFRVISALKPTDVPVPEALLLCEDRSVLGAPFYVMQRVIGHVIRDQLPEAFTWDCADACRRLSSAVVDALARLHAVDPAEVGLADFGNPDGYLHRQVRRWARQWELSTTRELPAAAELARRLTISVPRRAAHGIVHGDYRLDNLVIAVTDPGRVEAILDWEMCTIGDPLADLGLLLVYWCDPSDPPALVDAVSRSSLTLLPGFADRGRLVDLYTRATGAVIDSLDWYMVLGIFKLAVIVEGIHARWTMGHTVGDGFESVGSAVPELLEWGLERAGGSGIPGLAA